MKQKIRRAGKVFTGYRFYKIKADAKERAKELRDSNYQVRILKVEGRYRLYLRKK